MYADTRGWVRIRSTRPQAAPVDAASTTSPRPTDRREWVEAIRVARDILNQPAFAPYNDGELSPGPGGRDRRARSSTGSRADAETALHPSCTAAMGVDEMSVVDPAIDAGARRRGPPRRRRLGLPLRHQRQHLRTRDDGRREGRRPDRSATPRCPPADVPWYRHRDGSPLYPPGDSRNHRGVRHDHHATERPHPAPPEHRRADGDASRCTSRGSGRSSAPRPTRS